MDYIRIAALNPPDEGRSSWARKLLSQALADNVSPMVVPAHEMVSFTANLPPHLGDKIRQMATVNGQSPAHLAAGLIEAVLSKTQEGPESIAEVEEDQSILKVRDILRPLAKQTNKEMAQNKITFSEAATGTGKGRMICWLATKALEKRSPRVVVSAPIPIIWQLSRELEEFQDDNDLKVTVLFGRPNFVNPEELEEWAAEEESEAVLSWIREGGKPLSEASIRLSEQMGIELKWLLEDALSLDENIPVNRVMLGLNDEPEKACPAEAIYQQLRSQVEDANVIFCSHHLLAFHCRQMQLGTTLVLPEYFGTLIVDEAHQLESAFSSIYSETLHLHGLELALRKSDATGRVKVKDAIDNVMTTIERAVEKATRKKDSVTGTLSEIKGLEDTCRALLKSLEAMSIKKKDKPTLRAVARTKAIIRSVVSNYTTIRVELTPVRRHGLITSGQANLERAFQALWSQVDACALISATLYTEGVNGGLMRWKLSVPKERAVYLPPVIPSWVTSPVRLQAARVKTIPDESSDWHDELAQTLIKVTDDAKGGTLVLATAFATLQALEERLRPVLGDRLMVQSPQIGASALAGRFREHGQRPVWIGVGSAWTGIDLSDQSVEPKDDYLLSDLVICRLPFSTNRTLTHHRRMLVAGRGIDVQESVWMFRQGIGRAVRREGVPERRLWILDSRIDDKSPWIASFRNTLKVYKQG
ncbi:helicase C-terminal domain-containing protein [Pseudomonas luteola]